ncbi:MAG: hypothetical protein V4733_11265 [Verrucomicrobiota bacterium]
MSLTLDALKKKLPAGGLFGGGSWKWSPEPLRISKNEARKMISLGQPLAMFQRASDTLYRSSVAGREAPWLADWLDRGKPNWLRETQRDPETVNQFPRVIRPDLILTESGFAMSELDSVPGGIGVTAWLSRIYGEAGFEILGAAEGMIEGFRSLMPEGGDIWVSDEAGDYRPEMEWLAGELGTGFQVLRAENAQPDDCDIYRFFELFDWKSIPAIRELVAGGKVTPPFKAHLEDKLWLALLWMPSLQPLWRQLLRGPHLERLRAVTPFGWLMNPEPLPAHGAIPRLDVHDWREVAAFSQKQRQLVLKIGGFHETAWGSRGVFVGHDMSSAEWAEKIGEALASSSEHPWMMQEFREGRRIQHPVFRDDGSVEMMDARVRVCPYFFTAGNDVTSFAGCLATLVPADKKKIHGMSDGVLVPVMIGN